MKEIYKRFSEQSFRMISIGMLAMNDLITTGIFYLKASDKESFAKSWAEVEKSGALKIIDGDSTQLAAQVHTLFMQSVVLTCVLLVLFHWGIYLAYYFEKRLPYLYLKIATWFMAVGALYSGISMIFKGDYLGIVFIPISLEYLFVAYGLRLFPVSGTLKKAEQ